MFTALTIAGSDSSGGAGIQADIKTMTANRVYAMSAITALTAQNTTGVTDIMEVTPKFLAEQLDSIFTDINPDAIKTGMVSSSELIETIADKLTEYHAKNIVVDPVMVATSGARLISEEAIGTLKSKLLPLATVITPNIPEAEVLSEMEIKTEADMEKAAEIICNTLGCAVLLKGGHQLNDANDLLFQKEKSRYGSTEKELTIQIPMEQAVPYLPQLHQILQKEETWKPLSGMRKTIFPAHLPICLTLEKEADL